MTWDALLIGKVLYSTLSGTAGVSTRIYPMRIPQNIDLSTTSAISYYIISTSPEITKDSRSLVDTVRVQISIFSGTYTSVNAIAQIVRENLDGLSGEVAGCSVDSVVYMDEADIYEDEHKIYHRVQDYSIRVKNVGSANVTDMVVTTESVTGDYTWTAAVPAGFIIEYFLFSESTGNNGQISIGTSSGAANVISGEAIDGGGLTVVDRINIRAASLSSPMTLYINHSSPGDEWNGMNLNIYCVIKKIT